MLIKFSDIIQINNILFLHKLYHNSLPERIFTTFSIDFNHPRNFRAQSSGLIKVIFTRTNQFGTKSTRSQAIHSWNNFQDRMPHIKFPDASIYKLKKSLYKLKKSLHKFIHASYY